MSERDKAYIERINDELRFIAKAMKNTSKAAFLADDVIQHAISMSLLTIGECANHLSEKFREGHPQVEWIQIIAVRNIVINILYRAENPQRAWF